MDILLLPIALTELFDPVFQQKIPTRGRRAGFSTTRVDDVPHRGGVARIQMRSAAFEWGRREVSR